MSTATEDLVLPKFQHEALIKDHKLNAEELPDEVKKKIKGIVMAKAAFTKSPNTARLDSSVARR